MKAYLSTMGITAAATVLLAVLMLFLSLGNRYGDGQWAAEIMAKKTNAIASHRPKVVILAGSNALFGFSARTLSEQSAVESVNLGLHAGLGLRYILDFGRKFFAPGRLFYLPLEYELYGKARSELEFQYQVIGFDPDYLHRMSGWSQFQFALHLEPDDRVRLLIAKYHPKPVQENGPYNSEFVNGWGDETHNELFRRTPGMLQNARSQRPQLYTVDDSSWNDIVSFVRAARAAGDDVTLGYPNILRSALDLQLNRPFFAELSRRAARDQVAILGRPAEWAFDEDLAFDTYYHQNSMGQHLSTLRLSGVLAAYRVTPAGGAN